MWYSDPDRLFWRAAMADPAALVREHLPTCAAVAAEFRAVFGDVRMTYASENGHVIGKPGTDGVRVSETVVGSMALVPTAKGRR